MSLERSDEGVWLAVEREVLDALTRRRKLREKTTVRRLAMKEGEDEEGEEVRNAKLRKQFFNVVEEETRAMIEVDPELVTEEIGILAQVKKAMGLEEKNDDDEVLQTRIVSPAEVSKKWEEWLPVLDAEIQSL